MTKPYKQEGLLQKWTAPYVYKGSWTLRPASRRLLKQRIAYPYEIGYTNKCHCNANESYKSTMNAGKDLLLICN